MDKKKLLLVAVSVGIFLIIVIGLSILLFLPRRNASVVSAQSVPVFTQSNNAVSPSTVNIPLEPGPPEQVRPEPSRTEPASANPVDMLRNPEGIQGLQPPPSSSKMTQENNIYIYGDPTQSKTLVEQITRNNSSDLVIEVPKPSAVAVPSSSPTSRTSAQERPPQVSSSTSNAPKPTATPTTSSRPSSPPPAVTAPPPASQASTPQTRRVREDYWVQAGAFSTTARAEGAKKNLTDKGIPAIIENRDVNGQNFYRVRVGPYTSQNEAAYWLSVIQKINGFENSQIWQSSGDR
ncbi:MAG: SPOR domain-containing protein [Treponema sp.]|jgi:DedD protein|nr:SPOR domain-containing protein [Treponema sp.]